MSLLKLQSSDGVIFPVDAATVKQMVTIQTMIDHEDEDSGEITPVPTVKGKVLEKIIQWTEYHKIDPNKWEKFVLYCQYFNWYRQYFNIELKEKFEIIIAADYLEVKSLLNESCRNVLINNKWEIIEDAASGFSDPTLISLLQKYEVEHGYDLIVTLSEKKHLKCFDAKVR